MLGEVLADAFAEDPVFAWLIPPQLRGRDNRMRTGQGLGTQMLREVLAGVDTDGVPAYLESSNERNLPLYERNGFRVVGELQALGHGPAIWRMWREPQPRT